MQRRYSLPSRVISATLFILSFPIALCGESLTFTKCLKDIPPGTFCIYGAAAPLTLYYGEPRGVPVYI